MHVPDHPSSEGPSRGSRRTIWPIALLAAISTGLLHSAAATPAASPLSLGDVYRLIKAQEPAIPVPTPVGAANMGTFNVGTGACGCAMEEVEIIGNKPRTLTPTVFVNGVQAKVAFTFTNNANRRATLIANGHSVLVSAGKKSASVNVGRARQVTWTLIGAKRVTSKVNLRRPSMIGAGAFTIDALPVAVLYEPPQPADPAKHNSARYTQTTVLGTRITTTLQSSTATSKSRSTPGFEQFSSVKNGMAALGSALAKSTDPKGKVAGAALGTIASLMGRADRTVETVRGEGQENALELQLVESNTCETAAHAGPGQGDLIVFLQRARLIWLDDGSRTMLAFLGADAAGCKSVRTLRKALPRPGQAPPLRICIPATKARSASTARAPQTSSAGCKHTLSVTTVESLLKLDPFVVSGPRASLPTDRFEKRESLICDADSICTRSRSASVGTDDTHLRTQSTITTDDLGKGLLSFAGIGPSESKQVTAKVTSSSSTSFRDGKTVTAEVRIEGPLPGTDTIEVYYDRLFGTFALRSA